MNVVQKQTKPVVVEAVQFNGGSADATPIIDWVLANGGVASWKGTYEFSQNPDGTGQNGWSESIRVDIANSTDTKRAKPGDWIVKLEAGVFTVVSSGVFDSTYDDIPAADPVA